MLSLRLRSGLSTGLVFGLVLAVMVGGLVGVPARPAAAGAEPSSDTDRPVAVTSAAAKVTPLPAMPVFAPGPVSWPTAASTEIDLPVVTGARAASAWTRVGGLPVRLSPVATDDDLSGRRLTGRVAAPARVRVEVLDQTVARRGGVPLALRISRADGGTGAAKLNVQVDYNAFRHGFGGAYASRLELRLLPGCALGAVEAEAARRGDCAGAALDSSNDYRAGVVSADVDLSTRLQGLRLEPLSPREQALQGIESGMTTRAEPSNGNDTLVVALTASGDAAGVGTFGKTDLKESGTWSHSGASGNFSYSYPLPVPPVPGGLMPKLSLDYSSATVDGQTAAEHLQNGPIGEGWSLSGGGFIESTFRPCSLDQDHSPTWTNPTADPCWRLENYQLSWSGRSGELVPTGTANVWKVAADDAAMVEYVAASGYWKITTADGTQWFFGRQRLPGWTDNARQTNSVLSQEVFANHSDEQCFHSSGYTYSHCLRPYRWLLDYVVDPKGNSMSYWYSRSDNLAGSNDSGQSVFGYHRDAVLERIEYGTRAGNETTATAPAKVVFTNSERCITDCGSEASPNRANWPDVPFDKRCTAAPCNSNLAPSYWTTKRLTKITTVVSPPPGIVVGFTDEWVLEQSFPGGTDVPTLWLDSIRRTGRAGTVPITLPPLSFHGRIDRNRADYDPNASMADPQKYRIDAVDTESGGRIEVSYMAANEPACTWWAGKPEDQWPNYNHNASRCFMQYITNRSGQSGWSWWHKFVVDKVTHKDLVGGSPDKVSAYRYLMEGATSNHPLVLWGYTSGVWATPRKAMSAWKGYPTVVTTVGTGSSRVVTRRLYYRGLDRDTGLNPGQEFWRSSSVVDSEGTSVLDHPALAGQLREEIVHNAPDPSAAMAKTLYTQAVIATTAGGALPSWQTPPERVAYLTRQSATKTSTKVADGTWRTTESRSTWDATYGVLKQTLDLGQTSPALAGDELCTKYSYAMNTATHLIGYVSKTETTPNPTCGTSQISAILASSRFFYDNGELGAPPTAGNVTKTQRLKSITQPLTLNWVTESESDYDNWGRPTAVRDALGRQTTTVYTHTSTGMLSATKVSTPAPVAGGAGHETTTTFNTLRGLPTSVTDPNGKVTNVHYDGLGRVSAVRRPGNTTHPDVVYEYSITKASWPYVHTRTLGPNGNQISSYEMFDGLLRARQTQTVTEAGHRMITDTRYNDRGLADKTSVFSNQSAPAPTLAWPTNGDADIERQTRYLYDGAGRQVEDQLWKTDALQWKTITVYGGDRTGVIPPAGGTVTQDIVDARGRVVEKRQYQSPTGLTGGYDATVYGYDKLGRLTTVTDPAANTWTYSYDLLGRKLTTVDPDAGTSTTTYDDAGQVTSTKDALDQELFYEYDMLGRKTKLRQTSATGTVLADWTYDTVAKGQLASSTRFVGADAYRTRITDLDDGYRPKHIEVDIPNPTLNGALARTYAWDHTYRPNGAPATTVLPGVGGLPTETLTHTYDNNGFAQGLSGTWTGGSQPYLADNDYTYDGLISTLRLGAAGKRVVQENHHSASTRRPTMTRTWLQTAADTYREKYSHAYGHDPAGNITFIAGTTDATPDQTECFRYDHLRRLSTAWTQTTLGAGCTITQRAGADPYWRQWTFDSIGNRLTQTDKNPITGNPDAGDTTWTYTVGAAGAVKPHQLKQVTASGPLAGPARTFSYDAAGNTRTATTATGTAQTLAWDKEHRLTTVTEGNTTTASYIYDADGKRLISRTPTKTTLYLPDGTELEQASGGGPVLGTRYYTGVAVRDPSGLKWIVTNHQNTSIAQIDAITLTATRRRMLPYGEDRGTQPTGWMGTKGYVDGTKDPTGYTHLGAREYDPTLGRFISVDPIMDLTDPKQWNAYGYANGNPATFSDPSGLIPTCGNEGGAGDCSSAPSTTPPDTNEVGTGGRGPSRGKNWWKISECARGSWVAVGQNGCRSAGAGEAGIKDWTLDIIRAAWEAGIDPRLLMAVLIGESIGDRSHDERNGWVDRFLPDSIFGQDLVPSLGMANMQMEAFIETVQNHPTEFGLVSDAGEPSRSGMSPEGLWRLSIENEVLSIRAAAYYLRDLLDVQAERAGSGLDYSSNQLAGIGYNVGAQLMNDIASGEYASKSKTSQPMGPVAANYLVGFNDWYSKSDAWICGGMIIEC